jgi:hypothetical protein
MCITEVQLSKSILQGDESISISVTFTFLVCMGEGGV